MNLWRCPICKATPWWLGFLGGLAVIDHMEACAKRG